MSTMKMKAKVSIKFNLIVSVTQCRNAMKYALNEIEGSLIEHYVDLACDAYDNDISKIFNHVIDLAKKRPLLTMLEDIQIYAIEKMYKMLPDGYSLDLVQVDDHAQPINDVLAQPVATGKRIQKYSKKNYQDRVEEEGFEERSTDHHPMVLECNAAFIEKLQIIFGRNKENFDLDGKF
ncbi:unnamed protein product [Lactuca saligna]|uniref:Uncharacterized protein n=1 Tax=Lactuca saligna TaxID=75948 RepID=A0AA35ZAF1_LACSI|nr:unnamed protein product [Lactuca saligna]